MIETDYGKLAYEKMKDMERENLNVDKSIDYNFYHMLLKNFNFTFEFKSLENEIITINLQCLLSNCVGFVKVYHNGKVIYKDNMQQLKSVYIRAEINNCIVFEFEDKIEEVLITVVGKCKMNNSKFVNIIENPKTNKIYQYNETFQKLNVFSNEEEFVSNYGISDNNNEIVDLNNFTYDYVYNSNWNIDGCVQVVRNGNLFNIKTENGITVKSLTWQDEPMVILGVANNTFRFIQVRYNGSTLQSRGIKRNNELSDYENIKLSLNLKVKKLFPVYMLTCEVGKVYLVVQTTSNDLFLIFGEYDSFMQSFIFNKQVYKIETGLNLHAYFNNNNFIFYVQKENGMQRLVYLKTINKIYKTNTQHFSNYYCGFMTHLNQFFYNYYVAIKEDSN